MIPLEEIPSDKVRISNLTQEQVETERKVLENYITYIQQKIKEEEQRK